MALLFTALALLYFIFLVWLRNGLETSDRQATSEEITELPSVSLIIAARNEEKNMGNLLDRLLQQDYPHDRLTIIVADDNSSDATGEIVRSFAEKDSRVRGLHVGGTAAGWSPKKWALWKAIETSKGNILLFTDADCRMGPRWVANMVGQFKKEDTGMVVGPSTLGNHARLWHKMLTVESLGQDGLAAGGLAHGMALTATGRNLAVRRAAFNAVNGYEDIKFYFSGDDDLMMHKIAAAGWKVNFCLNPEAETTSPPPPTFREFVRQRLRFASKGKAYTSLPFVSPSFKWTLMLIYLTNVGVLVGQVAFLATFYSAWLLPWFLKMMGDGLLIVRYASLMARPFPPVIFLLDELWHSLYVVLFGMFGSFLPITWKGRRKASRIS